jgi:hypothetical protein
MIERLLLIFRFVTTHFLLPIGIWLLSVLLSSDFLIINLIGQSTLLLIFFTGYWEFSGLRLRNLFVFTLEILFLIILYEKLMACHIANLLSSANIFGCFVELFLLLKLRNVLSVIFKKDEPFLSIEFPFGEGTYIITDGGNSKTSRMMNYHYYSPMHKKARTNASMQFAVDIGCLENRKGNNGFFPVHNADYYLYDKVIMSPIDGIVFKIIDGIPDNIPYSGNYPYNTGNSVIIRNDKYYFLFGHIKPGSIEVREGQEVKVGSPIAHVGNSGWTERSHLHMQLIASDDENYWHGQGVNILFRGKNLYKNRVIRINK